MDKVNEGNANIVLLGDFNIDLLKSQPAWESTTSLFGLHQLINCATRITQTSATLLDHIYTNNEQMVSKVQVSDICISDIVQWSAHGRVKLLESWPKATQLFNIVLLNILIRVTFFKI